MGETAPGSIRAGTRRNDEERGRETALPLTPRPLLVLPGCSERRIRRDWGGASGTDAASLPLTSAIRP